jgi:hypothetical protein
MDWWVLARATVYTTARATVDVLRAVDPIDGGSGL